MAFRECVENTIRFEIRKCEDKLLHSRDETGHKDPFAIEYVLLRFCSQVKHNSELCVTNLILQGFV